MSTAPTLGVGVLTAQRPNELRDCLKCLAEGTRKPDLVVVLNNEPDSPINSILAEFALHLQILSLHGNRLEFAEARNRIVEQCETDLVAFLDDDCQADELWAEQIVQSLETFDAVGGLVLPANQMRSPADWHPDLNWLLGLSTPAVFSDESGQIAFPSTSNLAFKRPVWKAVPFQQLGGQIQSHALSNYQLGGEDAQFWRDVRDAGFKTTINPACVVFHSISEARYQLGPSIKRAQLDGVSSWNRGKRTKSVRQAAHDVVNCSVGILAETLSRRPERKRQIRLQKTWRVRQLAHLNAAASTPESGVSQKAIFRMLATESKNAFTGIIKSAARSTIVKLHRALIQVPPFEPREREEQTIGIVCSPFLGDTLILMPLVQQLLEKRSRWSFVLYLPENLTFLFQSMKSPRLKLIAFPYKAGLRTLPKISTSLYRENLDCLFITYYHYFNPLQFYLKPTMPIYTWLKSEGLCSQVWKDLATERIERDYTDYEQTSMRRLLAPLQVPLVLKPLNYPITELAIERVEKVMRTKGLEAGRFIIVLLDGREDEFKSWINESYKELVLRLHEETGLQIVFEGRRGGRSAFEMMDLQTDWLHSVQGYFNLEELAAFLKQSALVIGIDSGPIHLAQAVGTKSLAMFGCIDERRWGALPSPLHKTIRAENAPFTWTQQEADFYSHNEHMRRLKPEAMVRASLELLSERS